MHLISRVGTSMDHTVRYCGEHSLGISAERREGAPRKINEAPRELGYPLLLHSMRHGTFRRNHSHLQACVSEAFVRPTSQELYPSSSQCSANIHSFLRTVTITLSSLISLFGKLAFQRSHHTPERLLPTWINFLPRATGDVRF